MIWPTRTTVSEKTTSRRSRRNWSKSKLRTSGIVSSMACTPSSPNLPRTTWPQSNTWERPTSNSAWVSVIPVLVLLSKRREKTPISSPLRYASYCSSMEISRDFWTNSGRTFTLSRHASQCWERNKDSRNSNGEGTWCEWWTHYSRSTQFNNPRLQQVTVFIH